jgi:hypothetical protein
MRAHVTRYRTAYILAALLFIGFFLRLYTFTDVAAVSYQSDYNRDYLIADHIVRLHEFPLTGPEGQFGPYAESPLYFYLIALVLLWSNSIIFLGIINIVLQTALIFLGFLLAKELFGERTALLCAILLTFLDAVVAQSEYLWQPNLMQVFLLLSLLFLAWGYTRRRLYLFLSPVFFVLAFAMHFSALAIAPLYVIAVAYLERNRMSSFFRWCALGVAAFLIIYAPPIWYVIHSGTIGKVVLHVSHALGEEGVSNIAAETVHRFLLFIQEVFSYPNIGMAGVSAAIFLAASLLYLRRQERRRAAYGALFLGAVISVALASGVVYVAPGIPFPLRYYAPVFMLFVIFCAEMAVFFSDRMPMRKVLLPFIVLCFLLTGAFSSVQSLGDMAVRSARADLSWADPAYKPTPLFAPTANFLMQVGEGSIPHFYPVLFINGEYDPYSAELLWVPLEKFSKDTFVHLDDSQYRGYRTADEHMLLLCAGKDKDLCLDMYAAFFNDRPQPVAESVGNVMLYWF